MMTIETHTRTISLRAVTEADDGFLREVYASSRAEELARVPWTAEQRTAFLRMQFDAQAAHYAAHYRGAACDIIEVDGVRAGRLYVHITAADVRVVDIALIPAFRRLGIGAALLRQILDMARATGRTASVHVELDNPARRLYERLGFEAVEQRGLYTFMVSR